MKGLLLKDYYTLVKQAKIFILLIIVFSILGGSISGFALIYAAMLPITALAYDERAKWDSLAVMMPYSIRNIVLSKYILGYISIGGAVLLSIIAKFGVSIYKHIPFGIEEITSIIFMTCIAVLMLAFNLPFMFKFGMEKGRIAFFIIIAVVIAAGIFAEKWLAEILLMLSSYLSVIIIISIVLTVIINIVAVMSSIMFYKHRSI